MKGIDVVSRNTFSRFTGGFVTRLLGAGLLIALLTAVSGCGGEDAFVCDGSDCTSSSSTSTTTTPTTTTATDSGVQIGNGTGASFQVGVMSIDNTSLVSGGSANLSVSLVNADQTAYTTSTTINFSTSCATST
ncbi:MAG: hypothetical protein PVG89_06245, partial [Gammaproteobacteria bacterium]